LTTPSVGQTLNDVFVGGLKVKVEIFDRSPLYVRGLVDVLGAAGIQVLAAKTSTAQGLSSDADVLIVSVEAVEHVSVPRFVALASSIAPLLLLVSGADTSAGDEPPRCGVVSRHASGESVIETVRATAAGRTVGAGARHAVRDVLSPRERQVLGQIARGLTHAQVGTQLGISLHTVDTYVKRIKLKLSLGNKADLTRAALLNGVVSVQAS
jgi:DNA-binding NarL/FixJ family response regulator